MAAPSLETLYDETAELLQANTKVLAGKVAGGAPLDVQDGEGLSDVAFTLELLQYMKGEAPK